MYISANKNTYTPDVPLAEVLELQIKSTPDICNESVTYRLSVIKSFTNIVFFIQFGCQLLLFSLFITNRHISLRKHPYET